MDLAADRKLPGAENALAELFNNGMLVITPQFWTVETNDEIHRFYVRKFKDRVGYAAKTFDILLSIFNNEDWIKRFNTIFVTNFAKMSSDQLTKLMAPIIRHVHLWKQLIFLGDKKIFFDKHNLVFPNCESLIFGDTITNDSFTFLGRMPHINSLDLTYLDNALKPRAFQGLKLNVLRIKTHCNKGNVIVDETSIHDIIRRSNKTLEVLYIDRIQNPKTFELIQGAEKLVSLGVIGIDTLTSSRIFVPKDVTELTISFLYKKHDPKDMTQFVENIKNLIVQEISGQVTAYSPYLNVYKLDSLTFDDAITSDDFATIIGSMKNITKVIVLRTFNLLPTNVIAAMEKYDRVGSALKAIVLKNYEDFNFDSLVDKLGSLNEKVGPLQGIEWVCRSDGSDMTFTPVVKPHTIMQNVRHSILGF